MTVSLARVVASRGDWLWGGDGNSTLKVFDLDSPDGTALKQAVSAGGKALVNEMALTSDGTLPFAANNADDPPFAALFNANGDDDVSNVSIIVRIAVTAAIIPPGNGPSIEAVTWDPKDPAPPGLRAAKSPTIPRDAASSPL